jgi:GTP-binding protein
MTISLKEKYLPKVALVGRTNVGKSTLFNKLTEEKGAIVSPIHGTTRDRKVGECQWNRRAFVLIDTAGLDVISDAAVDREAVAMAHEAMLDADLVYLVVDVHHGLLPQDREYARMIRRSKKKCIVVINKVDSPKKMNELAEFSALGFNAQIPISAISGVGTNDLLDETLKLLPKKKAQEKQESEQNIINIAIVGVPNVGKSSLLNALAGEQRAIVSEVSHTTRDSQDYTLPVEKKGVKYFFNFIDTAGIIKKFRSHGKIEKMSVDQSFEAIDRASIVLLMIDASQPIGASEKRITEKIIEAHKSLILVANKWDLVEDKDIHSDKKFTLHVNRSLPYLTWAPIVFMSAQNKAKVNRLIDLIVEIYTYQNQQISEKELDKMLDYIVKKQPPAKVQGIKSPFIYAVRQVRTEPMTFEIITDQPKNVHFSYVRFIQNELRDRFHLQGVGLKVYTERYVSKNTRDKIKKISSYTGK